jgi:hypothetical protein
LDIHFSSTFSTQNFKGFYGKTNIKINRKIGIKIKNPFGGICPSIPSKYLFLFARRKFGFNKKISRKLLIVYVYYQQNSCTTPMERRLEEPFKDSIKRIPPDHAHKCTWRNRLGYPAHTALISPSIRYSIWNTKTCRFLM